MHWIALASASKASASAAQPADPQLALAWWALLYTPRVALLDEAVLMEVSASERLWGGRARLLQRIFEIDRPARPFERCVCRYIFASTRSVAAGRAGHRPTGPAARRTAAFRVDGGPAASARARAPGLPQLERSARAAAGRRRAALWRGPAARARHRLGPAARTARLAHVARTVRCDLRAARTDAGRTGIAVRRTAVAASAARLAGRPPARRAGVRAGLAAGRAAHTRLGGAAGFAACHRPHRAGHAGRHAPAAPAVRAVRAPPAGRTRARVAAALARDRRAGAAHRAPAARGSGRSSGPRQPAATGRAPACAPGRRTRAATGAAGRSSAGANASVGNR